MVRRTQKPIDEAVIDALQAVPYQSGGKIVIIKNNRTPVMLMDLLGRVKGSGWKFQYELVRNPEEGIPPYDHLIDLRKIATTTTEGYQSRLTRYVRKASSST